MTYASYLDFDRETLLDKLCQKLSAKRFQHVLGVEETAKALARHYDYDEDKAGLAALLHDYAKEESDQVFLEAIDRYQLDSDLKNWNNNVWHGLVGRYIISEELGLTDEEILRAIEVHTVGAKDMSCLDKIVYMADYIEPNRNFPCVERARELVYQSLDMAVAYATARTVAHLVDQGFAIYPQTLETYNSFVPYLLKDEIK